MSLTDREHLCARMAARHEKCVFFRFNKKPNFDEVSITGKYFLGLLNSKEIMTDFNGVSILSLIHI